MGIRLTLGLLAVAVIMAAGAVIAQPGSAYERYPWQRQSPVTMYYNPVRALPGVMTEASVRDGLLGWNGITPNIAYQYGGLTTNDTSICTNAYPDGMNTIGWLRRPIAGGHRAIACPKTTMAGTIECDIGFSPDPAVWVGRDPLAIALHEAGHCLGLLHSADPGAAMYSYAAQATSQPDDIAGICAIYGGCGATPTATPTPTPAPVLVSCERRATYSDGNAVITVLPLSAC